MPSSLAERLRAARLRLFVGRDHELERLDEALDADLLPFHVLYVYGPGGIGKTALLNVYRHRCEECGVPAHYLDARDVEPSAASFMEALRGLLGVPRGEDPVAALGASGRRTVLLIDTFEVFAPLSSWFRERFLPRLPGDVLLVLSGRHPRDGAWRVDAGLQAVLRVLPLRNLSRKESLDYLRRRSVPEAQQEAVLRFSYGHPLALSVVADAFDQAPDLQFDPDEAPDLVDVLVRRLLHEVLEPEQRHAIEASALVRHTTEPLLAALLDREDVHGLFAWLRSRSFMDAGRHGLFPHDLAREVLAADLRWRDAEHYRTMHRRARRYYTHRLSEAAEAAGYERLLGDYLFLHRQSELIRPLFQQLESSWTNDGIAGRDVYQVEDRDALTAMTERHEGAASAELLAYWLGRQPDRCLVFRRTDGTPAGLLFTLALERTTSADRERDPAVDAARAFLDEEAPLRGNERALLFRFWMDDEAYQRVSPLQARVFVETARAYLTTPSLAYTFLPCAEPAFWQFVFAFVDLRRLPAADFEVGGRTYGVFGHDWRIVPPLTWLERLADHEGHAPPARPPSRPPDSKVVVLGREAFASAVKEALGDYARPHAMADNPLLRSRLFLEQNTSGNGTRVEGLRELLLEVAEALQTSPRDRKYYRALHATYLEPAVTQEQAAERLDLPFSTYRRHLKRGLDLVTDVLWQRELGS